MAAPSHATDTKQNQKSSTRSAETNRQNGEAAPVVGAQQSLLSLHRSIGNRAFGQVLQAKLAISTPSDVYEQEADRIADQAMSTPVSDQHTISETHPQIQRLSGQSGVSLSAAPASVNQILASSGRPLDTSLRQEMEQRFGRDFSQVRVHTSSAAEQSARDVNANAYTVGNDIVFNTGRFAPSTNAGRSLLAHELTHVVQQQSAVSVMLHPVEKVLKFTAKYLAKRTSKTVSKHVARHARRIGGRAIHSVFKQPKKIKIMIEGAVREATELAAKHAKLPATSALREGAITVARQTTGTPGKFRWVVEKTFGSEIGTAGERILRIIIDQSGRVVTAFPTDRLIAIGLAAAALNVFGERSAAAAEKAHAYAAKDAAKEDDVSWWEFVPVIGDLWGGELNAGEDDLLRRDRELNKDILETIAAIEEEEKRSLNPEERKVVEDTFRAAIAAPLMTEGEEVE
jgi:hypothetical protein